MQRGIVGGAGLALVSVLVGCRAPSPVSRPMVVPLEMRGQASFPVARGIQATLSDIGLGATVSLIDPATNQALATELTTPDGHFTLESETANAAPEGTLYYVEAVKGLGNNAIGHDAIRVRTLIRKADTGWSSLTSADGGHPIFLNASTTALCVGLSLREGEVDPDKLIGTLNLGERDDMLPDYFESGDSGLTHDEFADLYPKVDLALSADTDPVAAISLAGTSSYVLTLPSGPALSLGWVQPLASPGDRISIKGTGFDGSAVVTFAPNLRAGLVRCVSRTELSVVIPPLAQSGPVTVTVGTSHVSGNLTLLPPVSGGLRP